MLEPLPPEESEGRHALSSQHALPASFVPAAPRGVLLQLGMPALALLLLLLAADVHGSELSYKNEILAGYDVGQRPGNGTCTASGQFVGAPPVQVRVQMYVERLAAVDQVSQTFTLDGYIRLFWQDERLAFTPCANNTVNCADTLYFQASEVWTPQIYFLRLSSQEISTGGTGAAIKLPYLLTANSAGNMTWSRQASITLSWCVSCVGSATLVFVVEASSFDQHQHLLLNPSCPCAAAR